MTEGSETPTQPPVKKASESGDATSSPSAADAAAGTGDGAAGTPAGNVAGNVIGAERSPGEPGAPRHPFGSAKPKSGSSFGVVALILFAVGAIVYALAFFNGFPIEMISILLGAGAVVFALLGIFRASRARVTSVIALIGGVTVIVLAALAPLILTIPAVSGQSQETADPGQAETNGGNSGQAGTTRSDAQTAENAPVSIPEGYATGGLQIVADTNGYTSLQTPQIDTKNQPVPVEDQTKRIHVFFDYQCPHCAHFEHANRENLEAAMRGGATIELHPLTFLDGNNRLGRSSLYAGALACVAQTQPSASWHIHNTLLDDSLADANIKDPAALTGKLAENGATLTEDTKKCITENRYQTFAVVLGEWLGHTSPPGLPEKSKAVTGVPFIVAAGKTYTGSLEDKTQFRDFLQTAGIHF